MAPRFLFFFLLLFSAILSPNVLLSSRNQLSQSFQQNYSCGNYTNCTQCTLSELGCSWCSTLSTCVATANISAACETSITYLGKNVTHSSGGWTFPFTCTTGKPIATTPSECPILNITVAKDSTASANYVSTLPTAILITVNGNFSFEFNRTTIVPGFYFVSWKPEDTTYKKQPLFFSYRANVLHNTPIWEAFNPYQIGLKEANAAPNQVSIDDIRIVGQPGTYRIGYTIVLRDPVTGEYTCGYSPSPNNLTHRSQLQWLFLDGGFIAQFPVFFLAVFVISIPIICCQQRFELETVRLLEIYDDTEETPSQQAKGGMFSSVSPAPAELPIEIITVAPPAQQRQSQSNTRLQVPPETAASSEHPSPTSNYGTIPLQDAPSSTGSEESISSTQPLTPKSTRKSVALFATEEVAKAAKTRHRGETSSARKFSKKVGNAYAEMLCSLFAVGNAELIKSCGTDAFFFVNFNIILQIMMGALACISLIVIIVNLTSKDFAYFLDYAGSTVSSIAPGNAKIVVHMVAMILFLIIFSIMRHFLFRLSRRIVSHEIQGERPGVIEIRGIPKNQTNEKHLRELLEYLMKQDPALQAFQSSIAGQTIVLSLNHLQTLMNQRDETTIALGRIQQKKMRKQKKKQKYKQTYVTPSILRPWVREEAATHYTKTQKEVSEKIERITSKPIENETATGTAYVTFALHEASTLFRKKCKQASWRKKYLDGAPHAKELGFSGWQIVKAPHYTDIIWENLGVSVIERVIRWIIANALLLIVLIVVYLFSLLSSFFWFIREFFKHYTNYYLLQTFYIDTSSTGGAFLLQSVNDIINQFPLLIAVVNEIIPPALSFVANFERHKSRVGMRKTFLGNLFFYLYMNTLVIPHIIKYVGHLLLFYLYADSEFQAYHYFFNTTGIEIVRFVMSQLLLGKSLELGITFLKMMISLAKRKKIDRMHYGYEGNFGFRVTLSILVLYYGVYMPALTVIVFIYLMVMFILDKWLIMYLCKPTTDSDGEHINFIQKRVFFYMLLFPLYITAISLYHLLPYMAIFAPVAYAVIFIQEIIQLIIQSKYSYKAEFVTANGGTEKYDVKKHTIKTRTKSVFNKMFGKTFANGLESLQEEAPIKPLSAGLAGGDVSAMGGFISGIQGLGTTGAAGSENFAQRTEKAKKLHEKYLSPAQKERLNPRKHGSTLTLQVRTSSSRSPIAPPPTAASPFSSPNTTSTSATVVP